jgi:multidrug efflux pump subunit AcrA (membrane-fusion protein)
MRISSVIVFVAAAALGAGTGTRAGDQGPAQPAAPKVAAVERGSLTVTVERAARVEPMRGVPLRLEFEAFQGQVTVGTVARRSGPVRAGESIATLVGKDFERMLADLRTQVEESRQRLAMQREEQALQARQSDAALERARLAARLADQSLALHREYESAKALEMAELSLKMSMDGLRDSRDELAQLERMYQGTSLQTETKDIVLERARRSVERGEVYARHAARDHQVFREIRHPNETRRVEDQAKDAALALEAAALGDRLGEVRMMLDVAQAERSLRDLERRLADLESDGRSMEVRSPADGYLVQMLRDAGDRLQPGQVLAEVVDLSRLRVRGTLNADAMRFVNAGMTLEAWFPARPEVRATVTVDEVVMVGAPEGEGAAFAFTGIVQGPDARLLPGMEARVVVRSTLTDRVLVPSKAVKASMGRWTVRVRVGEGEEERAVTVGASDGERTEVISGLEPGQQVVVPDA